MAQFSITKEVLSTLEVKKSTFHAFLFPASQFAQRMEELRGAHPKARHFVYAYRLLNDQGQLVENMSDDGEPKGSSGRPSLMVLRGAELIDSAVIVVRYFGGTKLGVGGLVRAYSDAINAAITKAKDEAALTVYKPMRQMHFRLPFNQLAKFEHLLKSYQCKDLCKTFDQSGVELHFLIAEEVQSEFSSQVKKFVWDVEGSK